MEITTKQVAEIIREFVHPESISEDILGITQASEEILILFQPWKEISEAPLDEKVDLLSNGVMRFCNCRWDSKREKWFSTIRYIDSSGQPQIIFNVIKNVTHFMFIPKSPLL